MSSDVAVTQDGPTTPSTGEVGAAGVAGQQGAGGEPGAALLEEIRAADERLGEAPAVEVMRWAAERFGEALTVACSFQDAVLIDVAVAADPGIEFVFLDTGFHSPETLEFVETCRQHFGMNIKVLHPGQDADPWPCGSEKCCERRKVRPLDSHLAGRQAWVTGLKRVDSPTRADAPVVAWDGSRGLVKINPVVSWTEEDISRYVAERRLPEHPLIAKGYLSIGCAPTTRPVTAGEDPRAGRWSGSEKTECGLHV